MSDRPKISIIIATHNSADYIEGCVDSILSQSVEEFELIVVDVSSDDGTKDILEELAREDARVTFLADGMQSLGHAKNMALDHARAPYVLILEPEDYLHMDALEHFQQMISSYPDSDVLLCDTECVGSAAYGRSCVDRKRFLSEANRLDSRPREVENRLLRDFMYNHTALYKVDYLYEQGIRHYEQPGYGRQDSAFRFLALVKGTPSVSVLAMCDRQVDARKQRISDKAAVTDTCKEFYYLRQELKKDEKLWWRTRLAFWQAYYDRNMLLYEQLADELRSRLAQRMQADIKKAIYCQEYSRDHFDITVRHDMELLLVSAEDFSLSQKKRLAELQQKSIPIIDQEDDSLMILRNADDINDDYAREESDLEYLSEESAECTKQRIQKYRVNRVWLMEEMTRDMAPLRLLLGLTQDEMSELLGVSASTYKSLEAGKKKVSWDQFLTLLFVFRFNDRTSAVVDTLGLYPESLKIRMKKGVIIAYG